MTPLELRVPGDKSIAHRAVLFGMLAQGESRIENVPQSADVASSIAAARAFGADIEQDGDALRVSAGGVAALAPAGVVDCGNSGTTARLCMGIAAALPGVTTFDGDASLRSRPMERVAEPLRAMGASIEYLERDGCLPLRVSGGALRPLEWDSAVPSAQVKSALLLAGLVAGVRVAVHEPAARRDHTERMLRAMGCDVRAVGDSIVLDAGQAARALRTTVPGDISSAAFLIAAALLTRTAVRIRDVGLNPTRTGFLDVVRAMGATVSTTNVREEGGEEVGDVVVSPSVLEGVEVAGGLIVRAIDELPLVGVLAAHARGVTTVRDAAELRVKESDRIHALCSNLAALGVRTDERPDGFVVHGTDAPLQGAARSFGDHRIAMAFAVLGLRPRSRIEVDEMSVARVSFPGFADQIERLRPPTTIGETA
jgi:3-phosphoshikimate 1-carboxyvinyltransferase